MNNVVLLIPHYNDPDGLIRSLRSIEPTERLDVLIVDDGSKMHKIDEFAANMAFTAIGSINYIYLEVNQGIEGALNSGLDYIMSLGKYQYIARLDSGDCCIGKRFEIQEKFLSKHPKIKLVGSNVVAVDTIGNFLYNIIMPERHQKIKRKMYLNSMFMHPSVMFTADVLPVVGKYPIHYKSAEDYAFFFKIVKKFETANLQQFLLKYEINPSGISLSRRKQQVESRLRVIWHNFYFGFYPIYGLVRNVILYIIPNSIIQFLKRKM